MPEHRLRIEPEPDFGRLRTVLLRQGEPDRVPFYELFSDIETAVLRALGRPAEDIAPQPHDIETIDAYLKQHVDYMLTLGYDYANVRALNFGFPKDELPTADTGEGLRSYHKGSSCTIASRVDFDAYPWPDVSKLDLTPFERIERHLPDGMGVITLGPGGVLENVMWLLGSEGISYLLHDDPELLRDIFDAVGSRIAQFFDIIAQIDVVGALVLGDDLGFKTQPLIPPDACREFLFPWHRRIVAAAHRHGKPVVLHACGDLSPLMDDIIACGWDVRHSFEDAIEPVWEAKARYGDSMAMLGGFDMDKICRMSVDEVRAHTRMLIEKCAPGGGWALGTGNSVANYVPVENLLAMLEEGFLAGKY